jgi:hypothetical protein
MFRVALKLALASAAVWAVCTFVPLRGRTLADRWRAAPDAAAFLERGLAELTGRAPARPARPQARAQRPARERAPERPTEGHTEADRRAIDRLVAEQLAERR